MFKSFGIKAKLLAICTLIASFVLVAGGIGFFASRDVSAKYHYIVANNLPSLTELHEMFLSYRKVRIQLRTIGLEGITDAQVAEAMKEAEGAIRDYETANKKYTSGSFMPGEKELYDAVEAQWKHFADVGQRVLSLAKSRDQANKAKLREIFFKDCPESAAAFTTAMNKMLAFQNQEIKAWVDKAESAARFSEWLLGITVVVGFALALLIGTLFSASLSKLLNGIADRLTHGSREVASATSMIAEAGTELSASSTEQAAALQQTVASLEEVSAMVNKSAENARRSLDTSGKSQEAANKGKQAVEEMIGSIGEINRSNTEIMGQIEQSNREISEIVKVIGEIGNKTKVINDIVFQTKLLSFNASVEAARAGEHGKGFAVVAEEVGNLAQMSGNAAKEISGMLEESIRKVQGIADDTKTKVEKLVVIGREKIESGSATANRCASVLEEIVANVGQVNQMVGEISTACREQAQGVQEINKAMGQLDQVTQQNSSAAQQSASAAEQLRGQTTDLDSVVSALHQTLQGGSGGSVARDSFEPCPAKTKASAETSSAKKSENVVPMRTKKKETHAEAPVRLKKAVGDGVPHEDDPRFEDV